MTEKRKIAQTANRLDYSISMTKCCTAYVQKAQHMCKKPVKLHNALNIQFPLKPPTTNESVTIIFQADNIGKVYY